MKLIVLAGAKKDAVVPLKKDRFVIGRSKECSLRAGSDAISRKHCELTRVDDGFAARDLGSRNGTFVNGERIEGDRKLEHGDTLKIGPLEFRFEAEGELNQTKKPKVNSVADAVARVSGKADRAASQDNLEESISDWLLSPPDAAPEQALTETQTFQVDETRAIAKQMADAASEGETSEEEAAEQTEEEDSKKKKEPGKLPKDALKPKSKDSREAAEQILRDMARRR